MKGSKKTVLIGVLVVAVVLLILGGILANLLDNLPLDGRISAGSLKLEVNSNFENINNWKPGDIKDYAFTYKNIGTKSGISRYKVVINIKNNELVNYLNSGNNIEISVYNNEGQEMHLKKIDDNGNFETDWIVKTDILNGSIEKDGETDSISENFSIKFNPNAGIEYQDIGLEVSVVIQLLQARNTVLNQNGVQVNSFVESQIQAFFSDTSTVDWTSTTVTGE